MQADETLASARWKILKRAILTARDKQTNEDPTCKENLASVRRFSSFNLFHLTEIALPQPPYNQPLECAHGGQFGILSVSGGYKDKPSPLECALGGEDRKRWESEHKCGCKSGKWFRYTYRMPCSEINQVTEGEFRQSQSLDVDIKHLAEQTSLEAMMGFNNTGNVCVWPSEEIMAHYCLVHAERFRGKTVCELGCGMTGLAGIVLAHTQLPCEVVLTDGNAASVANVRDIIEANTGKFGPVSISCDVLVWDKSFVEKPDSSLDSKFDYVICADCLFFEELHTILVRVMRKLLKPGGTVLIFAPQRAGSLDRFVAIASQCFRTKEEVQYDRTVWEKHEEARSLSGMYSPDLHFPLLLTLTY